MSTAAAVTAVPSGALHDDVPGYWRDVGRRFLRNRLAAAGTAFLVILLFGALFRSLVTFHDPLAIDTSPSAYLRGPSAEHWFGTDDLGRDVYSRVVYGSWVSMRIGMIVVVLTTFVGVVFGALAGYLGGWVDGLIGRTIDTFIAIPYVIVGVSLTTIFGNTVWVVIASLVVLGWLSTARLFRASVIATKGLDYIEAARAGGASNRRIVMRHILPNAIQPVIVSIAFAVGGAILTETVFSFLGFGLLEPEPAWGVMIRGARQYLFNAPHLFAFPAGALVLTALSFAVIGDGLRDALDPRLRGA